MNSILKLLEDSILDCTVVTYRDPKGLWHTLISERGNRNDLPARLGGVTLAASATNPGDSIIRCNQLVEHALRLEID